MRPLQNTCRRLLLAGLLFAGLVWGCVSAKADAGQPSTDADGLAGTWYVGADGFIAAMDASEADARPLLVYVYTAWCPYCRAFKEAVLANTQVRTCLDRFVKVRINPDDSPADERLADELGANAYPTLWAGPPGKRLEAWSVELDPLLFLAQCRAAIGQRR